MPPSVTATGQEAVKPFPTPPKVTLNVNGRAGHGAQASGSSLWVSGSTLHSDI